MLNLIFSLSTLWWMMLFLYIPACFGLIIIVLLQKGKGQGLAGAFGMGGGMDTIFGPRSSKSLPQKITYASAAVFMILALVMSILSGRVGRSPAPGLVADSPETSLEGLFEPAPEQPMPDEAAQDGDAVTESVITVEPGTEAQPLIFDMDMPAPESAEDAAVDEPVEAAPETVVIDDVADLETVEAPAPDSEPVPDAETMHDEPEAPAE